MKNNLRVLLAERRMNIMELSGKINITPNTLYGIYNEKSWPNIKTVKKIVDYFGVGWDEFLGEEK